GGTDLEAARHLPARGALLGPGPAPGARASRLRRADHRLPRDPGDPQDAGRPPAVRPAEARRAGPRASRRAPAAPARRAHGRPERRGEGRHVSLHPRREPGVRHDDRADRARHGRGHGHLGPRGRARLRPQDRRRPAGRDPSRPGSPRRLPGCRSCIKVEGELGARKRTGPMLELLYAVAVAPFRDMAGAPAFLVEVLVGGVFAGLMYSLVALGFVLIFKASGVFNFAQGVMVLFAALTLVGLLERGAPVLVALGLTTVVMIALAFAIERIVLR